jgi:hypothetical protein
MLNELTGIARASYLERMRAMSMSELDLLNLARSCGQTISSDFAQIITITFAMVVAIYYFLHQAGIRMKVFAFTIYTIGILAYLGMMLLESNVGTGAAEALRAIPAAEQSRPTQYYLGVKGSWVGMTSSILLNLVYWVLWLGTGYLLFFWKKPHEIAPPHR